MGNSNSQFKRSRSQYGSTRSVAFSLPSKWDRHSYAYGDPPSRAQSVSSIPHASKPILRNNSIVSSLASMPTHRGSSNNFSHSMHSLHEPSLYDREMPVRRHPTPGSISLTQRQYSDIYLKNDLRKVFRAQNRSNSVAYLEETDDQELSNPVTSLDRRLLTLKSQRNPLSNQRAQSLVEDGKRDGAIERRIKSRKTKKAPMPTANSPNHNYQEATKPVGMFRKKNAAPQPPRLERARSMSALNVGSDGTMQEAGEPLQQTLIQEIEAELAKNKIGMSSSQLQELELPKPDYDSEKTTAQEALNMPSQSVVANNKSRKLKAKAPTTPVKVVTVNKSRGDLAANQLSLLSAAENSKDSATRPQPIPTTTTLQPIPTTTTPQPKQVIVADIEVHNGLSDETTESHNTSEIKHLPKIVPAAKKEVREIAVQYDAPVEIAIQCSGDTLKSKKSDTLNSTAITEILQLFNDAIQTGRIESLQKAKITDDDIHDSKSVSSDSSSSCTLNSALQKVVPMHAVLAGVPAPPPLPADFNVKLIQTRTIRDHAPISMAPEPSAMSTQTTESPEIPSRNFSAFQQELRNAYEKMDEKRKANPTATNENTSHHRSSSSGEASALNVFRHARTIMGVTTPQQENESDSGHDEPSDCSNSISQGDRAPSIPDFVLVGIAKSLHRTESEWSFNSSDYSTPKHSTKSDKSKFNSIRKLTNSMKMLMSRKRRNSSSRKDISSTVSDDMQEEEEFVSYANENWTLSGRGKSARPAVIHTSTFLADEEGQLSNGGMEGVEWSGKNAVPLPALTGSSPHFKQTNMNSFSLLTPIGYPGASPKQHKIVSRKAASTRVTTLAGEDHIADVPL